MRKIFGIGVVCFVCFTIVSCTKEQVQKKVEDMVVQVMTDGVWLISKYQADTLNETQLFTGWECQFLENRTAKATNGTTVINGTWDGSYANKTMTGNFNEPPLNKLNGTWNIIKSNYTTGEFSREENGVMYKLEIVKK